MSDAVVLTPVKKGQAISQQVFGGFAKQPAPGDGLLLEGEELSIFLPRAQVEEALGSLVSRLTVTPKKKR